MRLKPGRRNQQTQFSGCENEVKVLKSYRSAQISPADVIHTVGPVAKGRVGDVEKEALRSCYRNSLNAAAQHAARSVVRTGGRTEGRTAEIWIQLKREGRMLHPGQRGGF